MAKAAKKVMVAADSELARVLAEARRARAQVLLEADGHVYPVDTMFSYEEQPEPDSENVPGVLNCVLGSWADLDIDAEIATVYRTRKAGSRPADRP